MFGLERLSFRLKDSLAVCAALLLFSPVLHAQSASSESMPGIAVGKQTESKTSPLFSQQDQSTRPIAEHKHNPRGSASSHDARLLEYGNLPLSFEANQGQTDERVKFLSRGRGYTLFLTDNQAVLARRKNAPQGSLSSRAGFRNSASTAREKSGPLILLSAGRDSVPLTGLEKPQAPVPRPALQESPENASVLRMELVGANLRAMAAGLDPLPGKSNFFIGNDSKKWRASVPNYAKVKYQDVYPGVDLVYYGNQGQLEYDFVVRPGADPKAIKITVGAGLLPGQGRLQGSPLHIDTNGDLVFGTDGGIRFHKPHVYQSVADGVRVPVDAHYSLKGDEASFELARYDRNHPLVIDPVLTYSTYLGSSDLFGGSNLDAGSSIAVDSAGNAYITGFTNSTDFPTLNPFQATSGGGNDIFVAKLNSTGSALVYSTYLGGSGNDVGTSIAVDSSGDAYVTGFTGSTNFPTLNPFQAKSGGGIDTFVSKLNPTGNALVYSTYLGGSGNDTAAGIAVDSSGNAYVTGPTDSTNFPTKNPFQAKSGGGNDIFVTKLNPTGSALVYSTYLGGSGNDTAAGIAVDSSGDAYVTGFTGSTNFPTKNPFQAKSGGGNDAFVSKLNHTGNALVYSTYLGGSGNDGGAGIAVDSSGNAYVTGSTASLDFPTFNALQASIVGNFDAFVTKLDAAGTALVYSTYFGSYDIGNAIAVGSSGNAYVAGWVQPFGGDIHSSNAVEGCGFGIIPNFDAFVTELKPDGTGSVFSTCLGGDLDTAGFAIALDSSGSAYVTGCTDSAIFATTSEAFQRMGGGGDCTVYNAGDAFVSKISPVDATAVSLVPAAMNFSTEVVGTTSALQDLHVLNIGNLPLTIKSISITGTNSGDFAFQPYGIPCGNVLGDNQSNGYPYCDVGITFTPTAQGARAATVTVTDDALDSPQTVALSGTGTTGTGPQAASPYFTPGAGTYTSAQSVTITDATSGSTIHYAINATPTASSTKYTGAITVSSSETIEAIAFASGYSASDVALAKYTINFEPPTGLQFIPVTPCRFADTRDATGPFGGPELGAGAIRTFNIPQSRCGIPTNAAAYSLNVTVVPNTGLGYLSIWPTGEAQPLVSTLNSDGRVKANAAIVPAGTSGGVNVYVSDAANVILDINGYFVPEGTANALAFYPVTPCRVVDTRNPAGGLGGPFIAGGSSRAFPIFSSNCEIPSTAKAYSLNVTAVPHKTLGYLSIWPTGQTQPLVSTLNSLTGTVTANAAIVEAGTGGDVSVFAEQDADVILDVNGYFAPPESGGLSLYTLTPCRLIDTRPTAFSGVKAVGVAGSGCAPAATAKGYVFNATVVPPGPLGYLTLWPDGSTQPVVSTLNAVDGAGTSNMAIVPTTNGSIDAYAQNPTNLILDISSYFAP